MDLTVIVSQISVNGIYCTVWKQPNIFRYNKETLAKSKIWKKQKKQMLNYGFSVYS